MPSPAPQPGVANATPSSQHAHNTHNTAATIADHRPGTQLRQDLQRIADNSPQVQQSRAIQRMADNRVIQRQLLTNEDVDDKVENKKKVNWSFFRPSFDKDNPKKEGKTEGLGASLKPPAAAAIPAPAGGIPAGGVLPAAPPPPKSLKTNVTWSAVDADAQEGKKMTANPLGPDHKLGSVPGSGKNIWNTRTRLLKSISGRDYIAGHLLNHNLGGPGDDARNLTAIPQRINALMSTQLEQDIKTKVNDNFHFIHYEVEITYSKDSSAGAKAKNNNKDVPYASNIAAKWAPVNDDGAIQGAHNPFSFPIEAPSTDTAALPAAPVKAPLVNTGVGAIANVDPVTHVILTNQEFVKIANKATGALRARLQENLALYNALKVELDTADRENAELTEELEELKKDNKELDEQISQLNAELEQMKEHVNALTKNNEALTAENAGLKAQLSASIAHNEELRAENEMLLEEIESLTHKNARLKTDNTGLINRLNAERDARRLSAVRRDFLLDRKEKEKLPVVPAAAAAMSVPTPDPAATRVIETPAAGASPFIAAAVAPAPPIASPTLSSSPHTPSPAPPQVQPPVAIEAASSAPARSTLTLPEDKFLDHLEQVDSLGANLNAAVYGEIIAFAHSIQLNGEAIIALYKKYTGDEISERTPKRTKVAIRELWNTLKRR